MAGVLGGNSETKISIFAMRSGSLVKGLNILTKLADYQRDWGLTELAKALDFDRSTAYRILGTMVKMGFVVKDQQAKRYRIGTRIRQLLPFPYDHIKQTADPTLRRLSQSLRVTVALRVREGNQMMVIDRVESKDLLRVSFPVGWRHSITFGGSGKVFLAFLPKDEAQLLIDAASGSNEKLRVGNFQSELWKELAGIKKKGYAISRGVTVKGAITVALPIFLQGGRPGGVLTMSWPSVKYAPAAVKRIIKRGMNAANRISKALAGELTEEAEGLFQEI